MLCPIVRQAEDLLNFPISQPPSLAGHRKADLVDRRLAAGEFSHDASFETDDDPVGHFQDLVKVCADEQDADAAGTGGDQYLYYNLSHWNGYNVDLMRTDLTAVKASMQA